MILIKNAKIYTMDGEVLEKGSILISEGKIRGIGSNLSEKNVDQVIDAEGRMMTPGLIDAHSHVGMREDAIGSQGMDHNERMDPVTPHMEILDGLNPRDITLKEAYEAGVTAVQVSPGSANVICGTSAVIKLYGKRVDDMVIRKPAGMKIAFGENPKRVHGGQGHSPATRMGTAAILRRTIREALVYQKKKEEGQLVYDAKMEAMLPVIRKEIPLKAHAHRADDIFTAIRIAREFDLDLTLDHCTDGESIAEDLAREAYPAIVGPSLGHRSKFELKNKSYRTAGILKDAGVKLAITTDSPVIPLHHLALCAGLCYREGMEEVDALKSITIIPAEISGVADRIGSLEVGKDADLVLFDGNPITDLDHQVYLTMIDGEIVYKR